MMAWPHTAEGLIGLLASVSIAGIWQGAVLTACMGACLRCMPGLPARLRCLLWVATFLVTALLPLAMLLHSVPGRGEAERAASVEIASDWALGLLGMWIALSVYRTARLVHGVVSLLGIMRRAHPVDATLLPARRDYPTHKVYCSAEVEVPCVAGFFSPRILLPANLVERATTAELAPILLHEAEHLRRHDVWTNLMQKVGLALFPLNPVLLWVDRRLCAERELACDDSVLRITGAPKAYATCLTRLAEMSLLRKGFSLALGAWQRESELSQRVSRILKQPAQGMSPLRSAAATATVLLVLGGGTALLHRAPSLIAFRNELNVSEVKAPVPAAAFAPQAEVRRAEANATAVVRLTALEVHSRKPASDLFSERLSRRSTWWSARPRRGIPMSVTHKMQLVQRYRYDNGEGRIVPGIWQQSGAMQRAAFTDNFDSVYAAIAVRDGWILIQL